MESSGLIRMLWAVVGTCGTGLVALVISLFLMRGIEKLLRPGGHWERLGDELAERRWPGWKERHGDGG